MKTLTITGSKRTNVGKKDAADLRRSEMVPCVIYGGKEPVHFAANEKQFRELVYTPDIHAVKIDVGGTQYDAVMKDIQFHRVTDKIIHIDFLELIAGKAVTMELPVKTEGAAPGVRAGGKLLKKMRTVTAKGAVDKFPEAIIVNVEKMEIGDSVRVKDLKIAGLEFLSAPNATIVAVRVTRNVAEEVPAAGAAATPAAGAAAATPAAAGAAPAAAAKDAPKKDAPKK